MGWPPSTASSWTRTARSRGSSDRSCTRAYLAPQVTGHDLLLDREVTWTLGFQVDDADLGMGGAGGSGAWFSFSGRYAAAYVTRGLGTHDRSDAVYELLEERYSRP